MESASVLLPPPLAALTESSASGSPTCAGPSCPSGSTYWLNAAASDGSHSMAELQLVEVALDHYLVEVKWVQGGGEGGTGCIRMGRSEGVGMGGRW